MAADPMMISRALLQSLRDAPLLIHDLPEAAVFPHHTLAAPQDLTILNFQQKLGHLYEDALAAMLENTPQYETVAKNLQIREETGRTLGELDFLVRDHISDKLIHLELAVKFYLAVETADGTLLPGPDARDNYFRKLEKMRTHQLQLIRKSQHLLPEEFRQEEITVQHLVYGCIFNHIHADQPADGLYLSPHGRCGKWLHASECADFLGDGRHLEIIPKPLWPASLTSIADIVLEPWAPSSEIERCVMIRVEGENTPYFITPNQYPSQI